MRYYHFCDCGPHFHCGQEIVQFVCVKCGTEYIGPDCDVTRPLPVVKRENGQILCDDCTKIIEPTAAQVG